MKLPLILLFCSATAFAQRPILRYDFASATATTVADKGPHHVTAQLRGSATTISRGNLSLLSLGAQGGYLDLTAQAGDIFRAQDDYSISVYYYIPASVSVSGNGFFLWAFSTLEACGATDGRFSCYRLNAQRIETSVGGYTRETGYEVGQPSPTGRWIHVAYTQQGTLGSLYIDGQLTAQIPDMPLNTSNYASQPIPNCWLGRAPFQGDRFLEQALVADFRLYDGALSAKQVSRLARRTRRLTKQSQKHGLIE